MKVDSEKIAQNFIKWLERWDQRLHSGQQEHVVEKIVKELKKSTELRDAWGELKKDISEKIIPQAIEDPTH